LTNFARNPFTLLSVSWPRPIEARGDRWVSEPEWDAPPMPLQPAWKLDLFDGSPAWRLDWREFFRQGIRPYSYSCGGEMRGFHIVFRLRAELTGLMRFWDDDGSIVRRRGAIVHQDRRAHPLQEHVIEVEQGDELEVAQWQLGWDWVWCGRIEHPLGAAPRVHDYLRPCLAEVRERLEFPDGPPLKMYTSASAPIRTIASIYSLVLNGYAPSAVLLYGEEQWPERARGLFAEFLPFAEVVGQSYALGQISRYGGEALARRAKETWYVMKALLALACPPDECCLMDDDVFVLDRVDDALEAFETCDLVYSPDQDLGSGYLRTWAPHFGNWVPLKTARFNAGLYWIRNPPAPGALVRAALRAPLQPIAPCNWEQGLIACAYRDRATHELPSQRYLFPVFDGLPGGMLGYDYGGNPCGFTSVHYGGLVEKPTDAAALQLLPEILGRRRNPVAQRAAGA